MEKRSIHIFLIDTFQLFQITTIYKGTQLTNHVRRLRDELLPLAMALERLPEADKEAIAERGTRNVNNYSKGVDGNRSGFLRVMLCMSPYRAICPKCYLNGFGPSQNVCYKNGLKMVFNGFGPSQNGCYKSGIKIVFKWSRPFKHNF